jgi:hypothetical protein
VANLTLTLQPTDMLLQRGIDNWLWAIFNHD